MSERKKIAKITSPTGVRVGSKMTATQQTNGSQNIFGNNTQNNQSNQQNGYHQYNLDENNLGNHLKMYFLSRKKFVYVTQTVSLYSKF